MLAELPVMERDPDSAATYRDIVDLRAELMDELAKKATKDDLSAFATKDDLAAMEKRLALGLLGEMGRIANVMIEHVRAEIRGIDDHATSVEQRLDAHVTDPDAHR